MSDEKNIQLDDELLAGAAGGLVNDIDKMPNYDAIGAVIMSMGEGQYLVRCDDGAELIASCESEGVVADGSKVGLFALYGGWIMRKL